MSAVANITPAMPPAPPGPATFDRTKFASGLRMVDTIGLGLNANVVNCSRLKAYGDASNPTLPGVTTPALATQIIYAPNFDASNNVQFNPTILVGNNCTYLTEEVFVQRSFTLGAPFSWTPPNYTVLQHVSLSLSGGTLGQTYPLSGGQVRGYAVLYVPQPALATSGVLYDLNGGTVSGKTAVLYH